MEDTPSSRLLAALAQMTDPQQELIARIGEMVASPLEQWVNPDSWLLTPTWVEAFSTLLQVHHSYDPGPLDGTALEHVFVTACRADGWDVVHGKDRTQRFIDAELQRPERGDQRPITVSIKSSSAKDMRRNVIRISKLCEAAWIQDLRLKNNRRPEITALFTTYAATTDMVFILRGFMHETPGVIAYELAEIPTDMFNQVTAMSASDFYPGTIHVPPGKTPPDFKITIDGSDAKVTLTGVNIDLCTVHATWVVPVEDETLADDPTIAPDDA